MGINPGNPAFGLPPAEDEMPRKIKDLERTMRENLASVASSFTTTVERLNAAIAQLIFPTNGGDSVSGFTLTTSWQALAHFDVTVPDGYSTAVVFASGSVRSRTITPDDLDYLMARININGIWSETYTNGVRNSYGPITVMASGLARVDGLSAGDVVPVNIESMLVTGPGDDFFTKSNVIAQVLFLH